MGHKIIPAIQFLAVVLPALWIGVCVFTLGCELRQHPTTPAATSAGAQPGNLPGSRDKLGEMIEQAVQDKKRSIIVGEATTDAFDVVGVDLAGGERYVRQSFRIILVLKGYLTEDQAIDIDYLTKQTEDAHERIVRKGERVIWIVEVDRWNCMCGLKALAYTPENQKAVKAGLASSRPPAAATGPAEPGKWTPWSAELNGLQFRIRSTRNEDEKNRLAVEIEIINVGKKDLYVADPGKMTDGDASVIFLPFVLVHRQRSFLESLALEPVLKPESFTLLLPGRIIAAEKNTFCALPAGEHQVYFSLPPGWPAGVLQFQWNQDDLKKVEAKAWRHEKRDAAMGPILVRRQRRE